ncbi:MAG: sensor histidine kinase N-terminal domain-containing protein [Methylococcaceae bacterium]|jgi:two-component system sensor histidine kinase TctE
MFKKNSLKKEILFWLILPLIVFVTFESILSYFVTVHYVNVTYDRWLLDSARSLMQEIKINNTGAVVELPPAALEIFSWDDQDKTFFKIVSADKGLLAGDPVVPLLNEAEGSADWSKPKFFEAEIRGEVVRVVAMQMDKQDLADKVVVAVAETVNKRRAMITDVLSADLVPQLLLVLIVGLYLLTALKRGLRPLNTLAAQIAQRSPRDLSPISEADVFLEVQVLTQTINGLLQRLAEAIAAQQRFVANAAHQLRTPLAGLKLQTERALRETELPAMQPALLQMQDSVDRASHTITQLLVLAKSEAADGLNEFTALNLAELVKELCIDWAPKALQRKMELSFDSLSPVVMVRGDSLLLRELLQNLLDNALQYGKENGHISVRVTPQPTPTLIVEDDGVGIPISERNKVFERFYRIPGSLGGGCGLGLAIVKEIADLHQAQLKCHDTAKQTGTCIEVVFAQAPGF